MLYIYKKKIEKAVEKKRFIRLVWSLTLTKFSLGFAAEFLLDHEKFYSSY